MLALVAHFIQHTGLSLTTLISTLRALSVFFRNAVYDDLEITVMSEQIPWLRDTVFKIHLSQSFIKTSVSMFYILIQADRTGSLCIQFGPW